MHSTPIEMANRANQDNGNQTDGALWCERSHFWREQPAPTHYRRAKRQREPQPLILSGFGVSLRIEGGSLRIRNGYTHHPQKPELFRYFRGDVDLPNRIVLLDCTGSLSFDVMAWLSEQKVTLIKMSWDGRIVCLSSPSCYAANPFRVEWQRATRSDATLRVEFCRKLICRKIESTIVAPDRTVPRSSIGVSARKTAYAALDRLAEDDETTVAEIRGVEGVVAAAYFRAWHDIPVRWRQRSRRPIPDNWKIIGTRSSGFYLTGSQNAQQPVQAILNYAYTVLQTQVQVELIAEGYDPTIGIMHESRADAVAFVFDMMKPRRAEVDRKILRFVEDHEFDPVDFTVRKDGVCRLNPEMARCVVQHLSHPA